MPVATILALISALTPVANNLISWIEKAMTAVKQGDLTDAQLEELAATEASQSWTIDPDPAPPTPVPPTP